MTYFFDFSKGTLYVERVFSQREAGHFGIQEEGGSSEFHRTN